MQHPPRGQVCLFACANSPADSPEVLIRICYLLPSFQTLWASSFSFSHRQRIAKILSVFHSFRGGGKENSWYSMTPVVTHNNWLRLEFHIGNDFISNLCCSAELKEDTLLASLSQDLTREFRFSKETAYRQCGSDSDN